MKCNFTERLKKLFSLWQICYTTYKYIEHKNNKIYTDVLATTKKQRWDSHIVNLYGQCSMVNISLHNVFFLVRVITVGPLVNRFMSLQKHNDRSKNRRDLKQASISSFCNKAGSSTPKTPPMDPNFHRTRTNF